MSGLASYSGKWRKVERYLTGCCCWMCCTYCNHKKKLIQDFCYVTNVLTNTNTTRISVYTTHKHEIESAEFRNAAALAAIAVCEFVASTRTVNMNGFLFIWNI